MPPAERHHVRSSSIDGVVKAASKAVDVLIHNKDNDVRATAVQSLRLLTTNVPYNTQRAVTGIPAALSFLVEVLRSCNDRGKEEAADTLGNLALNNLPNQRAIAAVPGVLEALVAALHGGRNSSLRTSAARTLFCLTHQNAYITQAVAVVPNVLQGLFNLIQEGEMQWAPAVVLSIATNNTDYPDQKITSIPRARQALVFLFNCSHAKSANCICSTHAVHALASWTKGNPANKSAVLQSSDTLPALSAGLNSRSKERQRDAMMALQELAKGHAENQGGILGFGAILPSLASLLGSDDAQVRWFACHTLGALVDGNADNQIAVAANRGALSGLVRLLGDASGLHSETGLQNMCRSLEKHHRQGSLKEVDLSPTEMFTLQQLQERSGDDDNDKAPIDDVMNDFVDTQAAAALWRTADGSVPNQKASVNQSICQSIARTPDALKGLVALLCKGRNSARHQAAGLIEALANENPENQRAVAVVPGALSALVGAMRTGSRRTKLWATRALCSLAEGDMDIKRGIATITGVFQILDEQLREVDETRATSDRALGMVELLDKKQGVTDKTQAAAAQLWYLLTTDGVVDCHQPTRQVSMADRQGPTHRGPVLTLLVSLLLKGSEETREQAMEVLWLVVKRDGTAGQAVAGIPKARGAVQIMFRSANPKVKKMAVETNLAMDQAVGNTKTLVGHLKDWSFDQRYA